jgi:hypothetical protein
MRLIRLLAATVRVKIAHLCIKASARHGLTVRIRCGLNDAGRYLLGM